MMASESAGDRPLRGLMVDDNPDDRDLAIRELAKVFEGIEITEVVDAAGLEVALEAGGFDLVITDYQVRWTDGLEVLRRVKQAFPQIPVVMFTGTGSEDIAVDAMKSGLDDYVLKMATHYARLPVAVRSALDKTQARRELAEARELEERAERRSRSLIENAMDIIAIVDGTTTLSYVSPSVEQTLGYPALELLGESVLGLCHRDDIQTVKDAVAAAFADPRVPVSFEFRVRHSDGDWRLLETSAQTFTDEETGITDLVLNARDSTHRRLAEIELRAGFELLVKTDNERRRLLSRLVTAQEEERKRIAEDIHDDSIQVMSAAAMRLQVLRDKISDPSLVEEISKLDTLITKSIARLRTLVFDLRPRVLDEGGLAAALRDSLKDLESTASCVLEDHLRVEPDQERRTILFRIAQEALANIRKHSEAKRVDVSLGQKDGGFHVKIADDGVGFAQGGAGSDGGGFGMPSMRERAEMFGGWLKTTSAPGEGTVVEIWVPEADVTERADGV